MQESRIDDYWNIYGSRDLSDSWTGFTQFTLLEEKPPDGYMWSGVRLTKRQLTSRPDHLWPELWIKLGRNAKLKEKHKWSDEKPKLDNARRLRGIYFIDPEGQGIPRNHQGILARTWKLPMAPAMPCKTVKSNKNCGSGASIKSKQNLRVLWKLVNLQDCVCENLYQIIMKTYCRKRKQFITGLQFGSQVYSHASSHENSCGKGSSG